MNTKYTAILGGLMLALLSLPASAAGPLTPPGAPGDGSNGGPSLTEVKAAIDAAGDGRTRIPAQTATYTISQPGNYVLTGNVTVASGNGININASNVTLDLGGFTITSTAPASAGSGIQISNISSNVNIRNGRITSGSTPAAQLGPGFTFGIELALLGGSQADGFVFEDLQIIGINGYAIGPTSNTFFTSSSAVARRVQVIGHNGFKFNSGLVASFGKVIDCDVYVYFTSGAAAVFARHVGQSSVVNTTPASSAISAVTSFNNYTSP